MTALMRQVAYEIDVYGLGVIVAYGEYCGLQRRILRRLPHLGRRLRVVGKMVALLTRGE